MGRKILWQPIQQQQQSNGNGHGGEHDRNSPNIIYEEEELEFHRVRSLRRLDDILKDEQGGGGPPSLVVTTPPQRTLVELMSRSLVVGQEVALAAILLAVHREIVIREDVHEQVEFEFGERSYLAMQIVYVTLFIIVYYSRQSANRVHQQRERGKKAIVRLSDGILLAVLLRFISGVLRTLTASYSSDTVYALSIFGMAIHLLACDYKYANGVALEDADDPSYANISPLHPRPAFLGGTVSLNAAFFSTVLLVSRIKSNATSYALVSSVVTLFAFYPASRHNIARCYPNSVGECLIHFWIMYSCCLAHAHHANESRQSRRVSLLTHHFPAFNGCMVTSIFC